MNLSSLFGARAGLESLASLLSANCGIGELMRGVAGTLTIKVVGAALLFTSQLIFARLLGVESYGTYVLAFAWMSILLIPGRQGFDVAAVRYVATYQARGEFGQLRGFLAFSRLTVLGSSTAAAICLGFGIWLFRASYSAETLYTFWLAAAALPVLALAAVYESMLRGLRLVVRAQITQSLLHPALLSIGLPLVVLVFGADAHAGTGMWVYFCATVVSLVALSVFLRHALPTEVRNATTMMQRRNWYRASAAMTLIPCFGVLLSQANVVVLGAIDGPAAAGLYGGAARIANLIQLMTLALITALAPLAAELHARGNRAELQRITSFGIRVVFATSVLAATLLIVSGQWVLSILGDGFVAAYDVLVVLVVGQLLMAAMAPAGILLNMTGYQNDTVKFLLLAVVVNLIACGILVPAYGAVGAALATAGSTGLASASMAFVVYRRLNILALVTLPRTYL